MKDPGYRVEYLLTSVNVHHQRVSMHGLRAELLHRQVSAIGIPSGILNLPEQPDNDTYEKCMEQKVKELCAQGFTHAAFGDIFLEDLRQYREVQSARCNVRAVFPLWKRDTKQLMLEFLGAGFKAVVVCVNASLLDQSFAGRVVDECFIRDLPGNVDPCGENGEFHTFCYDGPIFREPVLFTRGEVIYREYETGAAKNGFWFCDLLPAKV